jgi:hypothetical protein
MDGTDRMKAAPRQELTEDDNKNCNLTVTWLRYCQRGYCSFQVIQSICTLKD